MPNEATAKTMHCPLQRAGGDGYTPANWRCKGSSCMAWAWTTSLVLEVNTRPLNPKHQHLEPLRKYKPNNAPYEIAVAPPELSSSENFIKPKGENWKFSESFLDDEGEGWFAKWQRETDPSRLGTCGMIPKPTSGIESTLEEIAEELGEIKSILRHGGQYQ